MKKLLYLSLLLFGGMLAPAQVPAAFSDPALQAWQKTRAQNVFAVSKGRAVVGWPGWCFTSAELMEDWLEVVRTRGNREQLLARAGKKARELEVGGRVQVLAVKGPVAVIKRGRGRAYVQTQHLVPLPLYERLTQLHAGEFPAADALPEGAIVRAVRPTPMASNGVSPEHALRYLADWRALELPVAIQRLAERRGSVWLAYPGQLFTVSGPGPIPGSVMLTDSTRCNYCAAIIDLARAR